jgi:type II secretory pathway component HofQ
MTKRPHLTTGIALTLMALALSTTRAQSSRRITVVYRGAQLSEIVRAFSTFSGQTIVVAPDVGDRFVTADVHDADWRVGLDHVLSTDTLVARSDSAGIIRVEKERRIVVEYENAPLSQVIHGFSAFSGRKIVLASDAGDPAVTASIRNVDWQRGLDEILEGQALVAQTDAAGVLRISRRN